MPGEVKKFTIQAQLAGLDKLKGQIYAPVQQALQEAKLTGASVSPEFISALDKAAKSAWSGAIAQEAAKVVKAASGEGGAAEGTEKKPGLLPKFDWRPLATGVTAGLYDFSAHKEAKEGIVEKGGGSVAAGVAGGMAGLGILGKIADVLESLGPIKAIMKIIGAIMSLALLPLAMVLMAILMPFLMPLLQLLGKLPWAAIFKVINEITPIISKVLGYIWEVIVGYVTLWYDVIMIVINSIIWLAGVIGAIISWLGGIFNTAISGVVSVATGIWNGILAVAGFIRQVDLDILHGLEAVGQVFVGVGNFLAGGISSGMQALHNDEVAVYNWFVGVLGAWVSSLVSVFKDIYNWFVGTLGEVIGEVRDILTGVWNILSSIWGFFSGIVASVMSVIETAISGVWSIIMDVWNFFDGIMQPIFQAIGSAINTIMNILNSIGGALQSANPANWGQSLINGVMSLQTGGYVPQNTLAYIHAGETVIPAGSSGQANITVNVTGNSISSDTNIQALAQAVAKEMSNQVRRLRTW
jgi:hypothetical protein